LYLFLFDSTVNGKCVSTAALLLWLVYISYVLISMEPRDMEYPHRLGQLGRLLPDDGDSIRSPLSFIYKTGKSIISKAK
jgi:hypothetical protein